MGTCVKGRVEKSLFTVLDHQMATGAQNQEAAPDTVLTISHEKSRDADAVVTTGNKLDADIGWYYWKRYVAAAFWAQISMPMNLMITLLTALTTAQASAPDLLPQEAYKTLTYISLLLTVLNTFFRPHEKLQINIKVMKEWTDHGLAFEKIYFSPNALVLRYQGPRTLSDGDVKWLLDAYYKVRDDVNTQRQKEGPEMINFLTDVLHILCFYTCIRKNQKWSQNVRE
jgi:hypothetical protein